jgi:CHAD domain-containing protein
MPLRLPTDLLDRSAQESSRLLALSYLDQIDRAQQALGNSLEPDALHDFRVGLRRLRSALSAYRSQLEGSVTGKMRKQIRKLARATNEGRDTEVQLDWLSQQAGQVGADDAPALYWLTGRLQGRKQEAHDPAVVTVARRYGKVAVRLRRALGVLRIELDTGRGQRLETFGEVAGELVRQHVARLQIDLTRITGPADIEQVHRARINIKRLRYLLEPLARRNRRGSGLIRRLKEAQDLLGEHHDMHVLAVAIDSLRGTLPPKRLPGLEQGLATLSHLATAAGVAAFDRFQSIWGGQLATRILARADELGASLTQRSAPENGSPSLESAVIVTEPVQREPAQQVGAETG